MRLAFDCCLSHRGYSIQGQAADASETVELTLAERPPICLIAGDLPGGAVTALVAISSGAPKTRVVVMVEEESVAEARTFIGVGAAGYLAKDIACDSLARALRCVARGEAAVSRKMARSLLVDRRRLQPNGPAMAGADSAQVLTLRQHQVLDLLSRGASTAEIARALSISPVTARRHRGALRRKLGVREAKAFNRAIKGVHVPERKMVHPPN
jgi:DNA-binding NarL/FixJ family response regulator